MLRRAWLTSLVENDQSIQRQAHVLSLHRGSIYQSGRNRGLAFGVRGKT